MGVKNLSRITISPELEKDLTQIKNSDYYLSYHRGLDHVIEFLVKDFKTRKEISETLKKHEENLSMLIDSKTEGAVKKALKEWLSNILALKGL